MGRRNTTIKSGAELKIDTFKCYRLLDDLNIYKLMSLGLINSIKSNRKNKFLKYQKIDK